MTKTLRGKLRIQLGYPDVVLLSVIFPIHRFTESTLFSLDVQINKRKQTPRLSLWHAVVSRTSRKQHYLRHDINVNDQRNFRLLLPPDAAVEKIDGSFPFVLQSFSFFPCEALSFSHVFATWTINIIQCSAFTQESCDEFYVLFIPFIIRVRLFSFSLEPRTRHVINNCLYRLCLVDALLRACTETKREEDKQVSLEVKARSIIFCIPEKFAMYSAWPCMCLCVLSLNRACI